MKMYRALEFSKLQFLLDENQYIFWIERDLNYNQANSMNWWLDTSVSTKIDRKKVISTITKNPNDLFFDKSAEFNSVFGGRFNPIKSFGGIYCACSPFVCSLEVLYHYIMNCVDLLRPISKNKSTVQTILNNRFSNKIEVIVVAFEFEVSDNIELFKLNEDEDSLKDLCQSLGFERYLTDSFDRNFIFGNDYEISRIIGCHMHSSQTNGFSVPSARLDFDTQDELVKRNFFLPEKDIPNLNPKLTGKFKEFRYTFGVELNDDGYFEINLTVDNEGDNLERTFFLEPVPSKKNDFRKQIISYEHNVNVDVKKNLREVHTQKFIRTY